MLTAFLRRSPRCFPSNHLSRRTGVQSILQRESLCTESIPSSISMKSDETEDISDPVTSLVATSPRDIACIIVARLNEKDIGLTIRSFDCAQNRPKRVTRLTTRNNVDVVWMNTWFTGLHTSPESPFFPFRIPAPSTLDASRQQLYHSILQVNKYKNSEFFNKLVEGKNNLVRSNPLSESADTDTEIKSFVDNEVHRLPCSTTLALSLIIDKYTAEEINEPTMKRLLRRSAGIHAQILPQLFRLLGMPFATPLLVTAGLAAQEEYIVKITKSIEVCNAITVARRMRNKAKDEKKKGIDPVINGMLVTGSNPDSANMLTDLDFKTELSTMKSLQPRTVELRRRSLKSEHCLQITLDCITQDDIDYSGGYDDNASGGGDSSDPKRKNYDGVDSISSDWSNSPYKVFMENMAPDVTEQELIHSLRNCGQTKGVQFIRSEGSGTISTALSGEPDRMTADILMSKFGIKSNSKPRVDLNGGMRNVLLPKNPLAVISSVKRRPIKKTIVKAVRSDSGAFALMGDYDSFRKITADDMRIFGICVGGQNSRVTSVESMKTIFLETRACISAFNVKGFLRKVLGENHYFDTADVWANNGAKPADYFIPYPDDDFANNKVMPVFVVLRFSTHSLAWDAYQKIAASIEDGAPFRQTWTRTTWYYHVKAKAREMSMINQMIADDSHYAATMDNWSHEAEGDLDTQVNGEAVSQTIVDGQVQVVGGLNESEVSQSSQPVELVSVPAVTANAVVTAATIAPIKRKRRSSEEVALERAQKALRRKSVEKEKDNVFPFPSNVPPTAPSFYQSGYSSDESIVSTDKLRG